MIINLEQSERHLFMLSYKVTVFPRIQGGVPIFFHLRHIYIISIRKILTSTNKFTIYFFFRHNTLIFKYKDFKLISKTINLQN